MAVELLRWRCEDLASKGGAAVDLYEVWLAGQAAVGHRHWEPTVWADRAEVEHPAKHPDSAEGIVMHEMAHLRERGHGDRFTALMDELLHDWRARRDAINRAPLADEGWARAGTSADRLRPISPSPAGRPVPLTCRECMPASPR